MSANKAYPLHWPVGWPRTAIPQRNEKFGDRSVHAAYTALVEELGRLKATNVHVSSNITLGASPKDKGICVYFTLRGKPYALPCDKWDAAEDNLYALAKHIESMRGQERWGVGTLERQFAGYLALGDGRRTWREVMDVAPTFIPVAVSIETRYKELAMQRHPDRGGSNEAMAELTRARDEAMMEIHR